MADINWNQIVLSALGGGLTVKFFEFAYQDIRSRLARRGGARKVVDDHLDPILKSADEIVGKLRSLAEEDFSSLRRMESEAQAVAAHEFLVLLYLFANFWARVELLKRDAIGTSLQAHSKGRLLKQFLDCMESRRVRLLDRATQRAIGETLLDTSTSPLRTILFVEFVERIQEPRVWRWHKNLRATLARSRHASDRQRLLLYGVVLHALIDTLDPKHHVTRERPGWPNKLTRRTAQALRYRVFGRYLRFVKNSQRYVVK